MSEATGCLLSFCEITIEDYAAFVEEGKKQHILMVDAQALDARAYVRLAYCVSPEMIKRSFPAFERLAEACKAMR